ncbi:MAG: glycosyltransferase family 2 protein, partial [Candidatus Omnitrophica bacterium]|nr:glycosyltransferase family 2 protein [Candidatus Omnitrophota bacterium]
MLISIIIPVRDEEQIIKKTLCEFTNKLSKHFLDFEIIVVDDGSTDSTEQRVEEIIRKDSRIRYLYNNAPHGFGFAIRKGLEFYKGDVVVIAMADGSDEPRDVVRYCKMIKKGYDCVFGSRFIRNSKVDNYPWFKLVLNRLANIVVQILFGIKNNDITNAFKCYRREVIEGVKPILSHHFNLTVELPLKAIVRGYSYVTIPINWYGRKTGIAKFKIKEMG